MTILKQLWSNDDDDVRGLSIGDQASAIAEKALQAITRGGMPVITRYTECHPGKCSGFGLLFLPSTVSLEVEFGDYHLSRPDTQHYAQAMAIAAAAVLGLRSGDDEGDDEGDASESQEMLRKLTTHRGQSSQDVLQALVSAWTTDTTDATDTPDVADASDHAQEQGH